MVSLLSSRSQPSPHETQLRRNRLRRVLLETLERRELLAVDFPAGAVFAPGTPQDYVDGVIARLGSSDANAQGNRWTDPVGGASPGEGDPATITWSIVPDGTIVPNDDGSAGGGSDLITFMDNIYGGNSIGTISQKPWFNIFQRAYDRWSEVSGLTFVYEASDDGVAVDPTNRGVAGLRGDIRIGGMNIDGNLGTLAYNFFPTGGGAEGLDGDMVLDTNDVFFFDAAEGAAGENRGLFNVLMQQTGHGMGLSHVFPVDETKLMEPHVSLAFLGPQHDDILSAQELYGDANENDDVLADATSLGALSNGLRTISGNSIDRVGDDDWYAFSVSSAGRISLTLEPLGEQYDVGSEVGATGPVDTLLNQDLDLELLASDGTTVLAQLNASGPGIAEQIDDFDLPAGGVYLLRVIGSGDADADPQRYSLGIRLTGLTGASNVNLPPRLLSVAPNVGEIFSFNRTNGLDVGPNELVFRFDGSQFLDASSLDGIRITRSGFDEDFSDGDEVVIEPGFIGFGESERIVVARFASALPDDLYRVEVFGVDVPTEGITAVRNLNGDALAPRLSGTDRDTVFFDLELGAQVTAIVPQPTSRDAGGNIVQARNQIEVYFNEDDLYPTDVATGDVNPNPSVVDPSFYQLFADRDTVTNTDDVLFNPASVEYFPGRNLAILTFASDIDQLSAGDTTFRLRIGTNEANPPQPVVVNQPVDPGSTFTAASAGSANLGVFNSLSSVEVREQIVNASAFPLDFPGAPDMPSDRDVFVDHLFGESHLLSDTPDTGVGIETIYYTFNSVESFGQNELGQDLFSSITPQQEQRAREIFEFYGSLLGLHFVETAETSLPAIPNSRVLWIITGEIDGPGNIDAVSGGNLAVMDNAIDWDDRFGQSDDPNKTSWFGMAMGRIGSLLGLGHATELPPGTNMGAFYSDVVLGGEGNLRFDNDVEPIFPGAHDIVHGQYLHRPDSRDIDMYRFEVATSNAGRFSAEVIAERLADASHLDSVLTLYQEMPDGSRSVIAVNDDYFSEDSFMSLELQPGVYYLGVTASGNTDLNPEIADAGLGGTSEGRYQLRTTFRPLEASAIVDTSGTPLDGDADGIAGGVFNYWFNATSSSDTLFVDKSAPSLGANGSISNPYNEIDDAFNAAQPGDIVRLVPNGGADGDISTQTDNLAFEVGRGGLGNGILDDGEFMDLPQGVTVMVDAGVLFKMGGSVIGVGSSTSSGDRSRANLQILGTPEQQVVFTSYTDENLGVDTDPLATTATPGDWGGIIFRNALDRAEGRFDAELDGRFMNYVAYADMQHGGGQVSIDGQPTVITPLHMVTARPTLINNTITRSASAAISADPNSFEESTFVIPRFQSEVLFTPDYARVGPDIHGNVVNSNSINGLFVRVETLPGQNTSAQTVSGRWNDTDIVHFVADTLTVAGTSGGTFIETRPPELSTVLVADVNVAGGQLVPGNTYTYRMTFVDPNGNESIASTVPTLPQTIGAGNNAIRLSNLTPATEGFVARKLYRSDGGTYRLVAELDRSSTVHVDAVAPRATVLNVAPTVNRARLDASLVIDPGMIVKLQGGRIVAGISAQVAAEGQDGLPVIFTSRQDDRYGAGSTFDTNGDGAATTPQPGDWGGLYFGQMGAGSLDFSLITFAGGVTRVGATFTGFNPVEIHQSDVRIANSIIENNASGTGGPAGRSREGSGFNEDAAIFVRGAQPIIVDNIIRDNAAPAISIDPHSTNGVSVKDKGRVTGLADRREAITENKGPLLRGNALGNNDINAMVLRGVTLNTESVWDDTDIVHAVLDEIVVPDFHVFGGLRLQSSPDESLVVKFGPGAGLTSNGRPLDIDDRIGGSLQVVGSPGFPVILTSLLDDTVGAGFDPFGAAQTDTNNDTDATTPSRGDWRSLRIDEFSNDRNVAIATELEPAQSTGAGVNGIPGNAQNLGLLATGEKASDDNLRLGYTVVGAINNPDDIDVYSFTGTAGTQVWLDIDRTNISLDAVVELVDADGNILAQSDNSFDESRGALALVNNLPAANHVNPLQTDLFDPRNEGERFRFDDPRNTLTRTFSDFYSTNPLDPGLRVILPGASGSVNPYFVRVRSSNIDSRDPSANRADLQDPTKLSDGKTEGQYQLQIRLQQMDEVAGSSISFSDIRYATIGVEVLGMPSHSPLGGEAVELTTNNDVLANALDLGNLLNTDRAALSVAGELATATDVDWFRFEINQDSAENSGLAQHLSTVIDVDYADGFSRANTSLWLFYDDQNGIGAGSNTGIRLVNFGTDSNIADDVGAPQNGTDVDDLSRGSGGLLDAFIGSTALPSGTYYLAITSNQLISSYLDQYYRRDAGGNPLTRVEPVNSVARIIEDRFGGSTTTATPPLQVGFSNNAASNIVGYTLADLPLFITQPAPGADSSELITVSAMTGSQTSLISRFPFVEDVAIRGDGTLHAARSPQVGVINDGSEGGILQLDSAGNGTFTQVSGSSGIQTFEVDFTVNPPAIVAPFGSNGQRGGSGMEFRGLTYPQVGNTQLLYAVGSRKVGADTFTTFGGFNDSNNYVYRLDPTSLTAESTPFQNRQNNGRILGAGTQIVERGYIDTSTDAGARNVTAQTVTVSNASPFGEPALLSGDLVTIQTPNGITTFEWLADVLSATPVADTLPQTSAGILGAPVPTNFFTDMTSFELSSSTGSGEFEIDTGRVIVNNYFTLTAPATFDGSTFTVVDDQGNRVTFEFDANNNVTGPNAPITYDAANATQFQVSQAIINAINNPPVASVLDAEGNPSALPWSAQAFLVPGTNRISLTNDHSISLLPGGASPLTVTQLSNAFPVGPSGSYDGATFTITDFTGDALTFEFDANASVTPGNVPVTFSTTSSQSFLTQAVNAAINNVPASILANLNGTWDVQSIFTPGSNTLRLIGDAFVSLTASTPTVINPLLQSPEYGLSGNLVNDSGTTLLNNFDPALPLASLPTSHDGTTFTIVDDNGNTVIFEFDDILAVPGVRSTNGVPHVSVPYDTTVDTVDSLTQRLVVLVNNPPAASISPGVQPWSARAFFEASNNLIRFTGDASVTVDTPPEFIVFDNLFPALGAGETYDGATFTIEDITGEAITFELEDVLVGDGIASGNSAVPYDPTLGTNALSQAIFAAINAPDPAVLAILGGVWDATAQQPTGTEQVWISGANDAFLNPATGIDLLTLVNGFNALTGDETYDGVTFTITDLSGDAITFELEDTINNSGVRTGHSAVPFDPTGTSLDLTQAIASAINNPDPGVLAGLGSWEAVATQPLDVDKVQLTGILSVTVDPLPGNTILRFVNEFRALSPGESFDGATFTIIDIDGDLITFELEDTAFNDGTLPGNSIVPYNSLTDSASQVTQIITAAINSPDVNILVGLTGTWDVAAQRTPGTDEIRLTDVQNTVLNPPGQAELLTLVNGFAALTGDRTYDGATFTITDLSGDTITFELEDVNIADGVTTGNSAIPVDPADTQNALTQAVAAAINAPDPIILVGLAGTWEATAVIPPGLEEVRIANAQSATVLPPATGQVVLNNLFPALSAGDSFDGSTVTITDLDGDTITFEFEDTNINNGTVPGNSVVPYSSTGSQNDLTTALNNAINTPDLAVLTGLAGSWDVSSVLPAGLQELRLTGAISSVLDPLVGVGAPTLVNNMVTLNAGESIDGATFSIADASGDLIVFELNDITNTAPATPGVTAGNSAINYDPAFTREQLSQAISDGINNPDPAVLAGLAGAWEAVSTLPPGGNQLTLSGVTAVGVVSAPPIVNPLTFVQQFSPLGTETIINPLFEGDDIVNPLVTGTIVNPLFTSTTIQPLNQQLLSPTHPLSADTAPPAVSTNHLVPVEEYYTNLDDLQFLPAPSTPGAMDELVAAINAANIGITASAIGNRLELIGATSADFSNIPTIAFNTPSGAFNTLPFQFTESSSSLTQRLLAAIQVVEPLAQLVQGEQPGESRIWLPARSSFIQGLTDDRGDSPARNMELSLPQYGIVEGLAFAGSTMYAVSDQGDLFRVGGTNFIPNSSFNDGDFIETIYNPTTGSRVRFTSLTSGPRNLEGGALANTLFGIDASGVLYAFDTSGRPQHIFQDGNWFIQTDASNPSGLAFSNVDVNLWHVTDDNRQTDDGHGVNIAYDASTTVFSSSFADRRVQEDGGNSLYFGLEDPANFDNYNGGTFGNGSINDPGANYPGYDAGIYNTYDVPGGAHGSVVSNPLDLSDYSPADKPFLYFNYYLETENANADNPGDPNLMKDSFRVFVSGEDGRWQLVGTNNSDYDAVRGVGQFDELDYLLINDPIHGDSQISELFDAGAAFGGQTAPDSWRQARIDLSRFAGDDSVRIRFDFSTAGSMDVGSLATGGIELVSVAGHKLRDGQGFSGQPADTFQIDTAGTANQADDSIFEFELGLVLQVPSGASLAIGESFEVDGVIYTFATNNVGNNIQVSPSDTGEVIAQRILTKLQGRGLNASFDPFNRARIAVLDATNASPAIDATLLGKGFLQGLPGVGATQFGGGTFNNHIPVPVSPNYTYQQVRDAIRTAMAGEFNIGGQQANANSIRFHDKSIFLWNKTVIDSGPLGLNDSLQGDIFGESTSGVTGQVGRGSQRGQNNRFEGVYVDDIIVGFAERGEMVTYENNSTPSVTTFVDNPRHEPAILPQYEEIETGTYQIEIRRGATYGTGRLTFPWFDLFRSFDTNDRLAQTVSLVAASGYELADGQTFTLSDGIDTVTFEYDDLSIQSGPRDGVAQGNIAIPFRSEDDAATVAKSIRDAINGADAQATLDVVAGLSNGSTGGSVLAKVTDSRVVHLHGNVSVNNTGSAAFAGTSNRTLTGANAAGFVLHGLDEFKLTEAGDSNRFRDQGQVIIHSNVIRDSADYGIVVDAGARVNNNLIPLAGALAHPGSVIAFPQFNTQSLVPGTVLANNLLFANAAGGISFSGDDRNQNQSEAPVPFGRAVNNTIVGLNGSGIGINVGVNASPTLLNNIVSSLATGLFVDASSASTVIGAMTYHNNGADIGGAVPDRGTNAQVIGASEPLFVNAAANNYYLAAGSRAIDSSTDSLEDRSAMIGVRDPLGISPSPILAPNADITGQLRVDDPAISNPGGGGANPFKDRGAFDRADFIGPVAILQQPIDNDPDNIDIDRANTSIRLQEGTLDFFSILLFEPEGTGPDPTTVTEDAITLTQNGRLLRPGVDYVFGYNAGSRLIRLTPLSGIWRNDSVYEITLNNQDGFRITSPTGFDVADGQIFSVDAGGSTLTFEYDNDGTVGAGSIAVPFDVNYTANQLAAQIMSAINGAGSGLFAYLQGDNTVMLHGATAVSGLNNIRVGAIADVAGERLQANRISSLTQFTIIMPEVVLDYGDAPGANSTTLQADNGSRHTILPVDAPLLALGGIVDGDPDGQPSADRGADDTDSGLVATTIPGISIGDAGPASLQVPAPAGLDGQQIVISDIESNSVIFEFDTNGTPSSAAVEVVDLTGAVSAADVAVALQNAVNGAVLQGKILALAAVATGDTVNLNANRNHQVDVSAAASVTRLAVGTFDLVLPAVGVADGQYIDLRDGNGRVRRFEINDISAGSPDPLVGDQSIPVDVDLTIATPEDIAQALADAINAEVVVRGLTLGPATATGRSVSILGDDEEGVEFRGLFNSESSAVPVAVNVVGSGILDVWFDWNADGDFGDPGERVISNTPVQPGENIFMISTPDTAAIGLTTSRFRVSTGGNLLLGGVGIGGEVEDHIVEIVDGTPPVANSDAYSIDEDGVLTVAAGGVLGNDTDADGSTFSVFDQDPVTPGTQPLQAPAHGTLVLNQDGSFVYTPDLDFYGTDEFVYHIQDERLLSATPATVTITVNPINDRPTAIDDVITLLEDETIVRPGAEFTRNDLKGIQGTPSQTNELGQELEVVGAVIIHPNPAVVGGSVSVSNNVLTFTPPAHYNNEIDGPLLVELTIRDAGVAGADAMPLEHTSTLTINLVADNDAPQFTMPPELNVVEDAGPQNIAGFLTDIRPGPVEATDEATGQAINFEDQQISFTVTALTPSLFAVLPTIDASGTLVYELNPDVNNVTPFPEILVEVVAVDTGVGGHVLRNGFDPSLVAPAQPNTYDGVTMTVVDAEGNTVVFEFDDVVNLPGVGGTPSLPHVAIPYDAAVDTLATINQKIVDSLNNPPAASITSGGAGDWAVSAVLDAVTNEIRLDGEASVGLALPASVTLLDNLFPALTAGTDSYDGATFTITDTDGDAITFEFNDTTDTAPATAGVTAGNAAIDYDPTFTQNQLSQAIEAAINAPQADVVAGLAGTWDVQATLDAGTDRLRLSGVESVSLSPSTAEIINPLAAQSLSPLNPIESRQANSSAPETFTIVPTAINDAPEFTIPDTTNTVEDQGLIVVPGFMTDVRQGPVTALDEAAQTLTISIMADASAYAIMPSIDLTTGDLTYQLGPDVNSLSGHDLEVVVTVSDDGGLPAEDRTTKTFTIVADAINDAPSFDIPAAEVTVHEDDEEVTGNEPTVIPGFATNIMEGPTTALDETTLPATKQNLTFVTVSVSDPTLFEVEPTITPTGELTFVTAQDQNGQAIVVVRLLDDGVGTETGNGDDNQSRPDQTFTINLTAVNDPPQFTIPATVDSREDQGLVQVVGFATNLLPGPLTATDESGQEFTVHVQAVDPSAFSVQPAIAADGTLTYQTAPDVNSTNANLEVEVFLTDDGAAGPPPNNNTTPTQTFTIVAEAVNDAPSFSLSNSEVTVIEDVEQFEGTTETSIPGFASNIVPGPATATDEAGQVLSFDVVSVSAPELFEIQPTISATGELVFKTSEHSNGNALIVVRLLDDGLASPAPNDNDSNLHTFTISITPVNDAPLFTLPSSITVDEDEGLISQNAFATNVRRGPVGTNDENSQLLAFEVTAVDPSAFSVQPAIGPDGTLSFQTAPNVNSLNADLRVEVRLVDDGVGSPAPNANQSGLQTFTVVANPVNDDPTTDLFSVEVTEDTSITIQSADVLIGDLPGPTPDENGQSLAITQIERTSANGGVITPVFSGSEIVSFTYEPPANLVGIDTFLYVVADDGSPSRSGTGTVTISLLGVNDPPEFTKGFDQVVNEDSDTVTVANWATDILAGPPSATDEHLSQTVSFTVVANEPGLFEVQPSVSSDGTLSFKPLADANGTTTVTVTAVDDGSSTAPNINTSASQTFTIMLTAVNDAPVFTAGPDVSVTEDSGAYSQPWATNIAPAAGLLDTPPSATDEASQIVDFTVEVDLPGLFSVQPTISSTGQLQFTPAQDAFGEAVLTVTAVDRGPDEGEDQNSSASQLLTITINAVNDDPVAVDDNYSTDENSVLTVSVPGLLANDTDVDLPVDSISAVAETVQSTLGATVTINQDGSITYDPSAVLSIQQLTSGQSVLDSFVYRAVDSEGAQSAPATVSINVAGVDDPPEANADAYSLGVNQSRLLDVLSNDIDIDTAIDPRTIEITAVPVFGMVTVNQTGVVEYTAGNGFRGVDSFGYTVRDEAGNVSNEAIVTVSVNNAPVAVSDSTFTFKDEPIDIQVLTNDSDPDGSIDPATVQVVVAPTPSGTTTVLPDGIIRFTPAPGFSGQAQFSYVVSDNIGTPSNVADVSVRVQNSKWQNPQGSLDVNADGLVTPIDALLIINYLNGDGPTFLPFAGIDPPPFIDPSGDESVTPVDVLLVINFLNENSSGGAGEGEGPSDPSSQEYVLMVTPQQVIETVGAQVLREIEEALDESLSMTLAAEDELASAGNAAFAPLSDGSEDEEEDLVDLLSLSHDEIQVTVDEVVDEFFGQMGPYRAS